MRRSSLVILYLTVFVDILGFGIILPTLPFFAEKFGSKGAGVGAVMAAYSAMQFLGAPLLGRLSDRFGRRPVLLASLAGSAISLTLSGMAQSLLFLAVARAFAGIFGGSISTAQAYIADLVEPKERAKYMGLLGASIGMGFVLGPALGAALAPFGFGHSAFVSGGLAAMNLVFAYFKLPESRGAGPARHSQVPIGFGAFLGALHHPAIGRIVVATFLSTIALVAMEVTFALLGEQRFNLNPKGLGLVFTFSGVLMALVQGGLVGRLAPRLGERKMAIAGSLLMGTGLAMLPLMPSLSTAMVALGVMSVGQAFVSPSLSAMLSQAASAQTQGGTLGLGQSMSSAARATGPVLAGLLFDYHQAAPYFSAAGAMAVAALAVGGLRSPEPLPEPAVEASAKP